MSLVTRISWIQNTKQVLIGIKNADCYLPLLIPTTASHVVDILKGMSIKKRKPHLKSLEHYKVSEFFFRWSERTLI